MKNPQSLVEMASASELVAELAVGRPAEILSSFAFNLMAPGLVELRASVNRGSAHFMDYDTAWGTPGQLVGGTVWVQVDNILKLEQTIQT